MSATFTGTLFDGETLATRDLVLEASGERLISRTEGIALDVAIAQLRTSDRLASLPRFLYLPDGRSVVTADNDAIDTLLSDQRRGRFVAAVHWLEAHSQAAATATVMLVAILAAGIWWGLPVLARKTAFAVPDSIEQQAGRTALATLNNMLGPTQLTTAKKARVSAQLERLLKARPLTKRPDLVFRSMGGTYPNAFALPGGTLVISDELVALASDEELAAVLAHEIGHWQLRHGLQGVLRNSGALLVVCVVTGDLSALTTFAGALPLTLLQRGYSREFEQEADAYAMDLLGRAKIDVAHFASILKKLEDTRPAKGRDLTYLSTHPSTGDRIKRINPGGRSPPARVPAGHAVLSHISTSYDDIDRLRREGDEKSLRELLLQSVRPKAVTQSPPEYPAALRTSRTEGTVELSFRVDEQGGVQSPEIVKSSHPEFEAPALEAARAWKFLPVKFRGQGIPMNHKVRIRFILEDSPHAAIWPAPDGTKPLRLQAGDTPPRGLRQDPPSYPFEMSAQSVEGKVTLEFVIDRTGTVRSPRVVHSTHKEFEIPAIDAVMDWKFEPAERAGTKVAVLVSQHVEFNLDPPAATVKAKP
jgi:TonB family protein